MRCLAFRHNRYIATCQLLWLLLACCTSVMPLLADGESGIDTHSHSLSFVENRGQWHHNVRFRADLGDLNALFLEPRAFTYTYYDMDDVAQLHDLSQASVDEKNAFRLHGHTYKVRFLGASNTTPMTGYDKRSDYNNYFIGDDPTRWASHAEIFDRVTYSNLYEGIDLSVYSRDAALKYDFVVSEEANPYLIHLFYDGADNLALQEDGSLQIETSVGLIRELRPYSYQLVAGDTVAVPCRFLLNEDNVVSFFFPTGYDHKLPLIIDPVVVAATLSGSTATNYGHCATFDNDGNIYTGAISFGAGYSVSTGAFDVSFNGGGVDIAISKYNPTGTTRLFGTYIGGGSGDYPHSLIANNDNEIYVYGSSDSNNYPTTDNSIMDIPGGGTDIVVSHISDDGGTLLASTYIGGSNEDGRNIIGPNYGDTYRGEIMLDAANNVYIASCTQSNNFPITEGAFQTTFNPLATPGLIAQDGVVFKLSADFNALVFSTYLGGDGSDMVYGIRIADDGSMYVCGGAGDDNFPAITPDGLFTDHSGANFDGFVSHLSADGTTVLHGTFWGSGNDDQAYFIDLDRNNDRVLIYGQSFGTMPISSGAWGVEGSALFIGAFSMALDFPIYNTTVGGVDFNAGVPVAFLIDQCGYIYFSCYSAGSGWELTPDAVFSTGGFYVGVLEPDAVGLHYATYYTSNHVDGGTSRFDKRGIVYQGVCSGGDFATNPDAWATDQMGAWDIGVFKINFETPLVIADISTEDPIIACAPHTINFDNQSINATTYFWDFGDGITSSDSLPTHTFSNAGSYNVMLIAANPESCNLADTTYMTITLTGAAGLELGGPYELCSGTLLLDATTAGATAYLWSTGETIPSITVSTTGTYGVSVTTDCGIVSDLVVVDAPLPPTLDLGGPYVACEAPILLNATTAGATAYLWNNGATEATIPFAAVGAYSVTVTTPCATLTDEATVLPPPPLSVDLGDDWFVCSTTPLVLSNLTDDVGVYLWSNGSQESSIAPTAAGTYSLTLTDICGQMATDEVTITYKPNINALGIADFALCEDSTAIVNAATPNALGYVWNTGSTDAAIAIASGGLYSVTITGECNSDTEQFVVTMDNCNPLCADLEWTHLVDCTTDIPNTYTVYAALTGGTLPYTVTGDYTATIDQANQLIVLANLPLGSGYSLSATDANDCNETAADNPSCMVLPIELTTLEAIALEKGNYLRWATATETDNAYFSWYRSIDGNNFVHLVDIAGAGNSNNERQYTYFDPYLATGQTYYRLVQTDFGGNRRVVGTVSVQRQNLASAAVLTVSPVLHEGIAYITAATDSPFAALGQLQVYSNNGQLVWNDRISMHQLDQTPYRLDISHLSNGVYWIALATEGQPLAVAQCTKVSSR
ncbi:MAG: PKD domain-containing protein [Chitinophagales bacterium]|nr:PKD domain-containing protein [Chitinophagales bacterium]